jgi:hypothetical protein
MTDLGGPLTVLAVLALVAFVVFKVVQHVRQRREERRAALRSLGFEPVSATDPEVVARVVELCTRWKGDHYRVDNVLERKGSDHRVLLLDLHDVSGENHHPALLVVTSRRLDLPRFTLSPRIEMGGRLAAFANAILEKVVSHQGKKVSFPMHPSFERRHFVSGPNEDEIRRFFTDSRLAALAEKQHLLIEAGEDVFTVDRLYLRGRQPGTSDLTDVSERVEEAESLLRLFSARG